MSWFFNEEGLLYEYPGTDEEQAAEFPGDDHTPITEGSVVDFADHMAERTRRGTIHSFYTGETLLIADTNGTLYYVEVDDVFPVGESPYLEPEGVRPLDGTLPSDGPYTTLAWEPLPGHHPGQQYEDVFYVSARYRGMHCELYRGAKRGIQWSFYDATSDEPDLAVQIEGYYETVESATDDLTTYIDSYIAEREGN